MRAWLFDTLTGDSDLQSVLGGSTLILEQVMPRQSQKIVVATKPFLIYGLGNSTHEALSDSTSDDAEVDRQFFQVWVHDEGGSYSTIDNMVTMVRKALTGQSSKLHGVITIIYLETSAEFSNESYGTLFRYIRFQAITVKAGTP